MTQYPSTIGAFITDMYSYAILMLSSLCRDLIDGVRLVEYTMASTIDESRTQLIADLQERAEALAELNRIAIALTSEFDLQRLLQIITDAARIFSVKRRKYARVGGPRARWR